MKLIRSIPKIISCLILPVLVLQAESKPQPNVVVFLADDMGWGDAACYGNEKVQTPNIDKLASQGIRFTQGYSASGVCSPSRSAILTGRTPYRNGVWNHLSGLGQTHLREREITYPKLLQQAGYETCHVGKWHLLSRNQFEDYEYPHPDTHGYDYWMATQNNAMPSHENPVNFVRNREKVGEMEGFSAPLVAAEGIHWLKDLRNKEKPFVLSVWVHEPHLPIATDEQFSDLYPGLPDQTYLGNVTQLDYALGMVMDALDAEGVSDNTLIVFTSDNGPEGGDTPRNGSTGGLKGRKRACYEGGIRVPMVVRWPGMIEPGLVSEEPVIGSDIFSTVLDATGITLPSDRTIDGVSMIPAFRGEALERKQPLFWRTPVSFGDSRLAMRVGDWKIVSNDTLDVLQLYHISEDPEETNNLASAMPEKLAQMKHQLLATWNAIETEGPSEWWINATGRPKKGATLNY
ncbi:sulfatase-like hydrolase/transferase [Coraliomargarita algicola]|uniref:Sulfatase-like hydrolase/transferase n=1 Tax=Coraliomargarita algicola TaxID=3092156 RepID=A0ABZ0RLE3_9BACT|nr:sulfatase-like hydrolase/transferase [Coraliomargarita sp. J2-16]WPJ96241.1 sulfatase-like hydrolase/transferase [Coraliomargarita sp. J2-16]